MLDAIQDPGNAGTLVRTAAALGVSAVIALPGTADLWNAASVVQQGAWARTFAFPRCTSRTTNFMSQDFLNIDGKSCFLGR